MQTTACSYVNLIKVVVYLCCPWIPGNLLSNYKELPLDEATLNDWEIARGCKWLSIVPL